MGTLRSRDLVDRNDQAVAGVVEIEEPEVEFMNKRLNKPKGCYAALRIAGDGTGVSHRAGGP